MRKAHPAIVLLLFVPSVHAADKPDLQPWLDRPILGPRQPQIEVEEFCSRRVPRLQVEKYKTQAEWEAEATRLRREVLDRVVLRGEAAHWSKLPLRIEWLDTLPGGPGYRLKKLRYEAVPGLWIPAILYEPEKLEGKAPIYLAVNGHEGVGKSVGYKQIRCINLVKRGIIVLNPEWLGMGQLRKPGYAHYRMNQLDLCGASGLAPFYLSMSRGLDVLLQHPHADPNRLGVSGLSGGGWQTIIISSLDPRVKLCNPVAGYSSFLTRIQHHKDLGDSEQTPVDLATVADYTHLTAMLAPRPTLLTYNAKDECCFEAGYALPPLMNSAGPIFRLLGKENALRSHVNHVPGTHNYERENREAFYRLVGDSFFPGDSSFSATEIPCDKEIKTTEELTVELPSNNADFNSLALSLAKALPSERKLPEGPTAKSQERDLLRQVVKYKDGTVEAERIASEEKAGVRATHWKLKIGEWTVPAVELVRGRPKQTTILVADAGRKSAAAEVERLLTPDSRVLAVDLCYFGESAIPSKPFLFALLVSAVGERPLGIQASQLAAVARWARNDLPSEVVTVRSLGPRSGLFTLVAAALAPDVIAEADTHDCLLSLKEVIEKNWGVNERPELFCFGLLEVFDIPQLRALGARRSER